MASIYMSQLSLCSRFSSFSKALMVTIWLMTSSFSNKFGFYDVFVIRTRPEESFGKCICYLIIVFIHCVMGLLIAPNQESWRFFCCFFYVKFVILPQVAPHGRMVQLRAWFHRRKIFASGSYTLLWNLTKTLSWVWILRLRIEAVAAQSMHCYSLCRLVLHICAN